MAVTSAGQGGSNNSSDFLTQYGDFGLSLLAATGQFSSGIFQSKAISQAGEFQVHQLLNNALLADMQSKAALRIGKEDSKKFAEGVRQKIGSVRARLAAQGVSVDEGTALTVQDDIALAGARAQQEIETNAWRESFGYKVNASDYRTTAKFKKLETKWNSESTLLTAGLSALQSVAGGISRLP